MNKLVSTFIISSFTAAMGVSVFAADDGGVLDGTVVCDRKLKKHRKSSQVLSAFSILYLREKINF